MAGVDLPTGLTGKISVRTLAEGLYSNDVLNVGTNPIIYENVIAQFTGSSSVYIQTSLKNTNGNGSTDYAAYANNSSGANNFVDMGFNGPSFNDPLYTSMKPYDGYLFSYGPSETDYRGNLVIGTASANAHTVFIAGGTLEENIVGQFNHSLYEFYNPINVTGDITTSANVYTDSIIFGDGSIQEGSSVARLNAAFLKANNALANTGNAIFGHHLTIPDTLTANLVVVTGLQEFTGNALIRTATGTGNFKNITLLTGDEISTGNSGSINITTGSSGTISGRSGDISLNTGNGTTEKGKIYLNANVTVINSISFIDASAYVNRTDNLNFGSSSGFTFNSNILGSTKTLNFDVDGNIFAPGDVSVQTITTQNSIVFFDGSSLGYNESASPATMLFSTANNLIVETNNGDSGFSFNSMGFSSNRGITSSGNTSLLSYVNIQKNDFDANTPLITINASDDGTVVAPSNSYYMMHITGKSNNSTRFVLDSFGANTYPLISGRMGRGSASTPTAAANNDVLMRVVGNGYTGTQFPSSSPTKIDFVATENFSDTNRGTAIQFWNTPNGSNTIQKIASFNANEVQFTGTVYPTKGFIYNPVIYPSAQTAITLDMSDGPLVRAQTSTGLTVTLSNLTAGKIIELWITNTAGTGQTFTHGVSATNSTINSTTYSIPATSSICVRYVCFDGTLANTMCSIIHS